MGGQDINPSEPLVEPLTRRESEILVFLAEGFSAPEIAESLTLAVSSVKSHIQHVYGKLGVNSKRQALIRARQLGLLEPLPAAGLFEQPPPSLHGVIGPSSFLAIASPAAPPGRKHNLPLHVTRFIGREAEIAQLEQRLAENRLVTLIGSSGVGKTRLSLRAAEEALPNFADGVWLVELAPLSDPAFVPRAVANVLDVLEAAGNTITETITTTLQARQLLIVLDNCEHLAQACAQLCDVLLRACPKLQILATSREPLRLPGEIVWAVPPLSLPDPSRLPPTQELIEYSAVRLFVERARAAAAAFELNSENASAVARLCFHLDGIPLALELAAAWTSVLSAEQILARLDDRFRLLTRGSRTALSRQQTLRGAIDWSYDLLLEAERLLFRRLAVFAGGWTLGAAEKVAGDETVPAAAGAAYLLAFDILEVLSHLVDKSLVLVEQHGGEARYRMLETIHEYARQRLDDSGEAALVAGRHCAWCIAFLEQANPQLWGPEHIVWVDRLDREHENMRAALAWCQEHEAQSGLRLANLLEQFWILRGYAMEGQAWLQGMLARAPETTTMWAKGLRSQILLGVRVGDFRGQSDSLVDSLLSTYNRLEDKTELVWAYQLAGAVAQIQTSCERARLLFEASLAQADEIGFGAASATASHFLGIQAGGVGDYERAQRLLAKSILRFRELGPEPDIAPLFLNLCQMPFAYGVRRPWRIVDEETCLLIRHVSARAALAYGLANQGSIARAMGDYARAAVFYEASRAQFFEIGDQSGLSQVFGQMGYLFVVMGDAARARAALGDSLALRRDLGDRRGIGRSLNNLANAATLAGDYAQARAWLDESLELFQEFVDKPGLASTYNHLGNWALEQDNFALAETFYETCLNIWGEFGTRGVGYLLLNLAECARGAGDNALTRARLEQARTSLEGYGDRRGAREAEARLENLISWSAP